MTVSIWSSNSAISGESNIPVDEWVSIKLEGGGDNTYVVGKPTGNNAKFNYSIKYEKSSISSSVSVNLILVIYLAPYACCCFLAICITVIIACVIGNNSHAPPPVMVSQEMTQSASLGNGPQVQQTMNIPQQ